MSWLRKQQKETVLHKHPTKHELIRGSSVVHQSPQTSFAFQVRLKRSPPIIQHGRDIFRSKSTIQSHTRLFHTATQNWQREIPIWQPVLHSIMRMRSQTRGKSPQPRQNQITPWSHKRLLVHAITNWWYSKTVSCTCSAFQNRNASYGESLPASIRGEEFSDCWWSSE